MLETPVIATKRRQKSTPLESARAGAEEDSSADMTVIDPGPETTMSKNITQESATTIVTATAATAGHKLQICACDWRKVTSQLGLRIHQGKKRCLREERQRPRIDYFLRKGSNQSNEAQQPDTNHSLQCISTTVMEELNSSTVMTTVMEPTQPPRPAAEKRLAGHRLHVKWPGAKDKKLWESINADLTLTLKLRGTVEKKLEQMGDIIYQYGAERFGVQEGKGGKRFQPVSRRQQEIKRLIQERRQLRRQ